MCGDQRLGDRCDLSGPSTSWLFFGVIAFYSLGLLSRTLDSIAALFCWEKQFVEFEITPAFQISFAQTAKSRCSQRNSSSAEEPRCAPAASIQEPQNKNRTDRNFAPLRGELSYRHH
jgi:hypothetical protein